MKKQGPPPCGMKRLGNRVALPAEVVAALMRA
jgi:hypothetical protein